MDTPYSLALFCIVRYIQTLDLYWTESISIKKMKIHIWFNLPSPRSPELSAFGWPPPPMQVRTSFMDGPVAENPGWQLQVFVAS